MQLNSATIDRILYLTMFLAAFGGGYYVKGLVIDKDALAQEKITQQITQRQDEAANKVAERVMSNLSAWRQNTRDVVKEIHTETSNPIFVNICATDKYVSLFNDRQQQARKALAGELETKVQH